MRRVDDRRQPRAFQPGAARQRERRRSGRAAPGALGGDDQAGVVEGGREREVAPLAGVQLEAQRQGVDGRDVLHARADEAPRSSASAAAARASSDIGAPGARLERLADALVDRREDLDGLVVQVVEVRCG
ncbi:MAG: hypothetical protein U0470_12570 [Anaerolineae bacterium]